METGVKKEEKTIIEQLRDIRDIVSEETKNMSFLELKEYVESRLQDSLYPKTVWK